MSISRYRLRHRLLAAGAMLSLFFAASPAPAQDQATDPPRHDIRLGNTQNMRMGRDASGNERMEIHAPPQQNAPQQVGPFFIAPQVWGSPTGQNGSNGGQQGSGSTSGQTGQTGQTGGGQVPQPKGVMMYRPGQAPVTIPGTAGPGGQSGGAVIYRPGGGS